MNYEPERHVFDLDVAEQELSNGSEYQVQFSASLCEDLRVVCPKPNGEIVLGESISRKAYFERINELSARWGAKFEVRFYGFYGEVFSARILHELSEVRSLCINCIHDASNLECIGELTNLKRLQLGVYELNNKELLSALPLEHLEVLGLEESRTKALNLAPLSKASSLRSLTLYGHKKNIEAVGALKNLKSFVFNPAKTLDMQFLNRLESLRSLKLVLGGAESFQAVVSLPMLEELAFTQVRSLSEVGDLQRFPSLQRFLVQDQPGLESLKLGIKNDRLEHIWIYNCPNISQFSGLGALASLKSLSLLKTGLNLSSVDLPAGLTHLQVYSLKRSNETAERDAIMELGLIPEGHPSMPFFYK